MDETKIHEISLKYIESYFNENTLVDHQIVVIIFMKMI